MLDKMFGVSPPQAGAAHEPKVGEKNLRESPESKARTKSEFESALKKKLAKHKEDSRADKKEKKSSGEIKKKMTDVDDKMVSSGMASKESVVETPDSKTEIPAEIKVDTEQKLKDAIVAEPKLENMSFEEDLQAATPVTPGKLQLESDPDLKMPVQQQTADPAAAALAAPVAASGQAFESELSAEVDFKPNPEALKANKDVSEKLKAFDVGKDEAPEKAQAFEKNILEQLQKENSFGQQPSPDKKEGDLAGKDDGAKDLKKDVGDMLHVGSAQPHAFKSHIAAVGAGAAELSAAGKLEENREANIKEIMNQAQYLVKKGGGEVTVKMSPEGLGEVHLRVLLQDGKLNVEIQTQDKHVKKLVEDSLSELKSGLAAHRLSLEHVKINTVTATNADNNTQMQSNLNQGQSDQHRAHDFWNEVQSNLNQNSQQKSQGSESSEHPAGAQVSSIPKASASGLRTYGGTKGATINRVA